jgi:hypothetical protein
MTSDNLKRKLAAILSADVKGRPLINFEVKFPGCIWIKILKNEPPPKKYYFN